MNPEPNASHPSYDTVRSLVASWESAGGRVFNSVYPSRFARRVLGDRPTLELQASSSVLVPLMGPRLDWIPRPSSLRGSEVYLHCWDVFQSNDWAWERIFSELQPRLVTMTSRQAASRWRQRGLNSHWLPEALNLNQFPQELKALSSRTIDVLELGRKWESLHSVITPLLAANECTHLYQRDATGVIFPTFRDFLAGIRDAKTVVCVPGARTHPLRFGRDSIVTMRYLESMASGALPVGEMPQDLIDLAGYRPGIDLLEPDAPEILLGVVRDISSYSGLVARNSESVRRWGSWSVRIDQFIELIK